MSYRRSFRRLATGLALAVMAFAGCVSVAAAMRGETGTTPVEEQPIDWSTVAVIPYLSHGVLTDPAPKASSTRSTEDPYLSDVNVRPGESLGGPDGGPSPKRDAQQTPSVADIGSDYAAECQRLLGKGDPDELAVCLDLGARGGAGEAVWTDRD